MVWRLVVIACAILVLGGASPAPIVVGLDHIPIAVNDLESASERYRALGFTLKPGVHHDDGIRNEHAKFADGTELELITAPEPRDALTTTYRRHLAQGDGPAFLAFYAPAMDRVADRLDAAKAPYHRDRGFLEFQDPDPLAYMFFGGRNSSPTDRPEHFAHLNTAESLIGVWLAGDRSRERRLLQTLGVQTTRERVRVPAMLTADVAHMAEGDVVFLPRDRAIVPGRPIVGATLRVRDVAAARRALERNAWAAGAQTIGSSLFMPPSITHGIWLELRQGAQPRKR